MERGRKGNGREAEREGEGIRREAGPEGKAKKGLKGTDGRLETHTHKLRMTFPNNPLCYIKYPVSDTSISSNLLL